MSFPDPDIAETVLAAFDAGRLPTEVLRTCPPSLWLPVAVVAALVLSGGAMAAWSGVEWGGLASLAPHTLTPHALEAPAEAPACPAGGSAP